MRKAYIAFALAVSLLIGGFIWSYGRASDGATFSGGVEDVIARMMEQGLTSARGDGFSVEIEQDPSTYPVPELERDIPSTPDLDPEGRAVVVGRIQDAVAVLREESSRFETWIELGQLRLIVRDYDGAKAAWEYAAILGPDTVTPFHNLGDLSMNYLKDYAAAEGFWMTALKNDPENPLRHRLLFELYQVWKPEGDEAVHILQEGIAKFPNVLDLHVLLARLYRERGQIPQARAAYDAALSVARAEKNTSAVSQIEKERAEVR